MIAVTALVVAALVGTAPPVDPSPPAPPAGPSAASRHAASARAVPLATGRGAVVRVSDSVTLVAALASVLPGQTIELAPGRYRGPFSIERAGTEAAPITLRGSPGAVLDGADRDPPASVLRLSGASHWQLVGFTVTGARAGVVLDRTDHTVLSGLHVGPGGSEGVRIAGRSAHDIVQDCLIHDVGVGLRVGGGPADRPVVAVGRPDRSDGTKVINNTFRRTTGSNLRVHESTRGGLVVGNLFDGSRAGTAPVLDLLGVGYRIVDNVTSGTTGFRTRVVGDPASSGCGNTFDNNFFAVTPAPTIVLGPGCPAPK